jgi:deazaflavin-dependent oxidoreductase (nitroreductase family)
MTETRYIAPDSKAEQIMNATVAWLTRRGVSLVGSRELRVVGRSSGEVRTTPVNLLDLDGEQYLVAPRGLTQWVRNIRVAGGGELVVGRRVQAFTIDEVPDADKLPILREYLRRWGWEVGKFFDGVTKDATDDELLAIAPGFPVFRVVTVPEVARADAA